jgi:hypothetical protein
MRDVGDHRHYVTTCVFLEFRDEVDSVEHHASWIVLQQTQIVPNLKIPILLSDFVFLRPGQHGLKWIWPSLQVMDWTGCGRNHHSAFLSDVVDFGPPFFGFVFAPVFRTFVVVVLFAMDGAHEWAFFEALLAHEMILHSVDRAQHRGFGTNVAIVIGLDSVPFASEPCVRGPRNPHQAMLFGLEGFDVTTLVPGGKAAPNRATVVAPIIPKEHAGVTFVGLVFGRTVHHYT